MKRIDTYFVETHEYDLDRGLCIQVEYARYETDPSDWMNGYGLGSIHHTILQLGVF